MTREILRMPSQYAVDHPTFPVNQRYFHLIVIQEGLLSRNGQAARFGIRRVHRETFLLILQHLLCHVIQEDSILGFLT